MKRLLYWVTAVLTVVVVATGFYQQSFAATETSQASITFIDESPVPGTNGNQQNNGGVTVLPPIPDTGNKTSGGRLPSTNELSMNILYFIVGIELVIIWLLLFLLKRRSQDDEKTAS